jgi:hypothetical protein
VERSCPLPLKLILILKFDLDLDFDFSFMGDWILIPDCDQVNNDFNPKGSGQECPLHTGSNLRTIISVTSYLQTFATNCFAVGFHLHEQHIQD